MWGLNLDSWTAITVAFLAVGVFSAAVVVVSTFVTSKLQKQEAIDAQNSLAKYKLTVDGQVADAKKEGITAGKTAGDAILKASEADERAANANERAAALEVEATRLKTELARVKTPLTERHVSQEQRNILVRDLSGKKFPIGILAPSSGREINTYALEIIAAIEATGLKVNLRYLAGSINNSGINAVPTGVNLTGGVSGLLTLRDAFTAAHIPFGTTPLDIKNPFSIPEMVFISVGDRPNLSD